MAYFGAIYRVLSSAPSDLPAEDRQTISRVINDWNVREAETRGAAAVLMDWEGHTAAQWGVHPQESINDQLVDMADVVLAVFWNRLGSPTGNADSGTVEEITRAVDAGKYVAVLRCTRPTKLSEVDLKQLQKLEVFFKQHRQEGLVKEYDSELALVKEVEAVLLFAAARASTDVGGAVASSEVRTGPLVVADVPSVGRDGRFRLLLLNEGDLPAYGVTFDLKVADGIDGQLPDVHGPGTPIERLRVGQSLDFPGQTWGGGCGPHHCCHQVLCRTRR